MLLVMTDWGDKQKPRNYHTLASSPGFPCLEAWDEAKHTSGDWFSTLLLQLAGCGGLKARVTVSWIYCLHVWHCRVTFIGCTEEDTVAEIEVNAELMSALGIDHRLTSIPSSGEWSRWEIQPNSCQQPVQVCPGELWDVGWNAGGSRLCLQHGSAKVNEVFSVWGDVW